MTDEWLLITDDWLLIIRKFIKLRKFLMIDGVHTENTEGNGGPQADEGGERKLKRINRELKEMGPQADRGGEQGLINDERLLIIDYWWLITDCWLSSHGKCGGCG